MEKRKYVFAGKSNICSKIVFEWTDGDLNDYDIKFEKITENKFIFSNKGALFIGRKKKLMSVWRIHYSLDRLKSSFVDDLTNEFKIPRENAKFILRYYMDDL